MLIWRVEDSNGHGPYVYHPVESIKFKHNHCTCHPGPGNIHRDEQSGFRSLKQLFLWFNEEDIHELEERGFQVYRYKALYAEDDIKKTQVIFIKEGGPKEVYSFKEAKRKLKKKITPYCCEGKD